MTTTAYTSEFVGQKDIKLTVVEWAANGSSDLTVSLPFQYIKVTTTGTKKIYLNSTPDDGEEITIADHTGNAATTPIEIRVGNVSHAIVSAPDGVGIDTDYGLLCLKYIGSNSWIILYGR